MLLYTMTDNEIKNEIQKELDFIFKKIAYREKRIINQVKRLKRGVFPICIKSELITNHNNVGYLVYVIEMTRTKLRIHCTAYFLMQNHIGKYKLVEVAVTNQGLGSISIYSAHFFERYAERLELDVKGLSAIEHFISHYHRGTHYRESGKIFEPYPFGMGLGIYNNDDATLMYMNTFISNDLFYKEQKEITNIIKEKCTPSFTIKTIMAYE